MPWLCHSIDLRLQGPPSNQGCLRGLSVGPDWAELVRSEQLRQVVCCSDRSTTELGPSATEYTCQTQEELPCQSIKAATSASATRKRALVFHSWSPRVGA